MADPRWLPFVVLTVFLGVGMVGLARLSTRALEELLADSPHPPEEPSVSSWALVVNVVFTHGVVVLIVLGAALWADIPWSVMGLSGWVPSVRTVGIGVALGLALVVGSEGLIRLVAAGGWRYDDALRRALAPQSPIQWVLLVGVALPIAGVAEELVFRAALVGVVPRALGVSPWVMVLVSSVGFGLAHDAQGRAGVVVTGLLGAVLAGAFVLTSSIWVVAIAHLAINVTEFAIHREKDRSESLEMA